MRKGFFGAAPPKRADPPREPRGDPNDGLGFDRAFEEALLAQEARVDGATKASSSGGGGDDLGVALRSSAVNATSLDGVLTKHWPHGHVITPSADGHADNVMLMLHGRGDVPAPFAKLARRMALPRTVCVALQGPHPIPFVDDGRAWFTFMDQENFEPIDGTDPTDTRRTDSLERVVTRLSNLIDKLTDPAISTPSWRGSRVHLFGFSDGGTVALTCAMRARGERRLGGCATVCASLLPEQLRRRTKEDDDDDANQVDGGPTPVTLTAGASDRIVSVSSVRETSDALIDAHPGHVGTVHVVPGKGHAMVGGAGGEDEMKHLMGFWALTLWRPDGGRMEASDLGEDVIEVDGMNARVERVVVEEEETGDPYALD